MFRHCREWERGALHPGKDQIRIPGTSRYRYPLRPRFGPVLPRYDRWLTRAMRPRRHTGQQFGRVESELREVICLYCEVSASMFPALGDPYSGERAYQIATIVSTLWQIY
jgi:hypothetical protein